MSDFQELFGVNSERAFKFFHSALRYKVGESQNVRNQEIAYVASVLAHYSQTSRYDKSSIPTPADLSDVFDNFVWRESVLQDSELLELAGSQSLLLAGFFRDQMQRRHNVKWYDHLGSSFYESASRYSRDSKRQKLFNRLSTDFPYWTSVCRDLSREMRDNRYLISATS